MQAALPDLSPDHLCIICLGQHADPVHHQITFWPLRTAGELPAG